jgi:hypothetical protein
MTFRIALRVVEEAIDSSLEKNPAAVALGRQGGLKGATPGLRLIPQNNGKQ